MKKSICIVKPNNSIVLAIDNTNVLNLLGTFENQIKFEAVYTVNNEVTEQTSIIIDICNNDTFTSLLRGILSYYETESDLTLYDFAEMQFTLTISEL